MASESEIGCFSLSSIPLAGPACQPGICSYRGVLWGPRLLLGALSLPAKPICGCVRDTFGGLWLRGVCIPAVVRVCLRGGVCVGVVGKGGFNS